MVGSVWAAGLPAPGQLRLSEALVWAGEYNRDIQAARRALESAQAAVDTAGGRPNPTLSLNAVGVNLGTGGGGGGLRDKQVDTVLRVDQPIERGDKRSLRLAQADANLQAVSNDLRDVRRRQLRAVTLAYWDLRLAQDRLRVMQETSELMRIAIAKNELRLRAGDIAAADLARLQIEALRVQSDVRAALAEIRRARIALAQLLADEARAESLVAVDPWPVPTEAAPALPGRDHLNRRSDMMAAAARVVSAEQGKALALALRERDVTVGIQFEHYPPDGRRMVGVGVSVPLFTGYDYSGEIKRAWSDWGAAQDNMERTVGSIRAELAQLSEDLSAAAERALLYRDQILPAARKAAAAVELAYSNGAAGVLDLLDARRTLRMTESDAYGALADYARAQAGVTAAWESPPN